MYGVAEYEPKEDEFELFEKEKESTFDDCKQRNDPDQNINDTMRREETFILRTF